MRCTLALGQVAKAGLVIFSLGVQAGAGAEVSSVELAGGSQGPSRVRAAFRVGGDLTLEGKDGKAKVPMSVVAEFSYREQAWPGAEAASTAADVKYVRYYDQAQATIKIDQGGVQLELPEARRLIFASAGPASAILCSPDGPLTREELDLIDIPAGTHLLDRLLPGRKVAAGGAWKHDKELMRLFLGMDEVSTCEVESVLTGEEQGYARMRLSGTVYGRTDGALTELEVKAGYLFDTRLRRITRLNLAFTEKREAGRIGPAVDVTGKLTLEVDPLSEVEGIADDQLAKIAGADAALETRLLFEDKEAGLRFLSDRQWYITSEESERMVLRRVDGGEFIAQCNVIVRPERQEGRQATLAEFERDIRFSLGERFDSLVSTDQWTNEAGLLCYRMVVHGHVDDLPVEWRYYLAAPSAGKSVALAVSVEPRFTEQLGDADRALVETMELFSPPGATPAASGESAHASAGTATK
jgi:hypothetical protein